METYADRLLSALGDPTRRLIFERLAECPRAVGDLARDLPISRPAVSQHLKILKEAGLVVDRRVGTRRLCQVNPNGVAALRAYFDQFWDQSLAAFKEAAEQDRSGADKSQANTSHNDKARVNREENS